MRSWLLLVVVLWLGSCQLAPRGERVEVDVCVYGATSAGVIAAMQAVQDGRSVALLDCDGWVGGLTTSGLGATDVGNKAAIGGLARLFYRRLRAHYADDRSWTRQTREQFRGRGHRAGEDAAWTFEPSAAQKVFAEALAAHGIVARRARLDRSPGGVQKDGKRITSLRCENGDVVSARVFLDCTYEGDLLAAAGCSFFVGREACSEFDETLDGVQIEHALKHQFTVDVDPYNEPGNPESGLLPHVHAGSPGVQGERDQRVQAYCYRICATDDPDNRTPWPRPDDYDVRDYELLLRYFEAGSKLAPWHPVRMPNRKTDSNNNGAFSTDFLGGNYDYPTASYAERERIAERHRRYQQGLFWTLANHERVPAKVREQFQRYGLARDEFVANDNWPPLMYVREGRRLIGEHVITEHQCMSRKTDPDPVGLGAYAMDSHNVQRYVDARGFVRNEGDVQVRVPRPYGISYRALVPRSSEVDNLIVPVCVSATHIAFGSIRMEPVFMVLAQSAAIAADLAIAENIPVQRVPYERLRQRLLESGQVLAWTEKR